MEFNKIMSVSGKPGLFKILSQTKTGVIVQSLVDGKRMPIAATSNVSLLENIAIYTEHEEVPLAQVFKSIADKENNKEAISHKASAKELTTYFSEILPDYDSERVYTSNIKKVIQWYNVLVNSEFDFSVLNNDDKNKESQEED